MGRAGACLKSALLARANADTLPSVLRWRTQKSGSCWATLTLALAPLARWCLRCCVAALLCRCVATRCVGCESERLTLHSMQGVGCTDGGTLKRNVSNEQNGMQKFEKQCDVGEPAF